MRSLTVAALLAASASISLAGPYSPPAGIEGSDAIAWDDSSFAGWASGVASLTRGLSDASNPASGQTTYGNTADVLGQAGTDVFHTLSLGDGGSITLTFDQPITNGPGADFAVFENSHDGLFLELAFVEVSSDGVNFLRFPNVSLTQTTTQVGTFGQVDTTNISGLAGKYIVGFGTPFDLQDLVPLAPGIANLGSITHVRLTDVVGSINPLYGSTDTLGNLINEPFTTPFATGGFDLDAVGVIHLVPEPAAASLACALAGGLLAALRRRRSAP